MTIAIVNPSPGLHFNYGRAWRETAEPLFRALPDDVLALYHETRERARDCKQDVACRLTWPKFPDATDVLRSFSSAGPATHTLRAGFEAIDHDTLALASAVIENYGHWHPSSEPADLDKFGTHWKFSNLADQVLAANLGLHDRFCREDNGFAWRIIEGELRGCIGWRDGWTWRNVGIATRETYERARALEDGTTMPRPTYPNGRRVERERLNAWANACESWLDAVAAETMPPADTTLGRMLNAGKVYMEPRFDRCKECGTISPAKYDWSGKFRDELEREPARA